MREIDPLPWHRILVAVLSGALSAWGAFVLWMLLLGVVEGSSLVANRGEALGAIALFALFGLPVVFAIAFLIAWPLALLAVGNGLRSRRIAIFFGSFSAFLPAIGFLTWRLVDATLSKKRGSRFSYGGSEGRLWENNWPTALGWWNEVQQLALFAILGAFAGYVTHRVLFRKQ